ncbi:hypothetical protein [Alkalihalobacillus sp. 1P02AB]|uniref:hypothetical protein n=1 Tax=Alkalihalobacillus sp. 1P02AB TaxID=3132260 RepID=UPI0039A4DE2E
MNVLIFIMSYLVISLLVSLFYIGLLMFTFMMIKKIFHMNQAKWDSFFKFRKGRGLYYVMTLPYLLTLLIMFPLSMYWFDLIDFEFKLLSSLSMIMILTLTGIFKFSKLKEFILYKI